MNRGSPSHRPFRPLLAALVLLLAVAAGCRHETSHEPTADPGKPYHGGTLVVATSSDVGGFNELTHLGSGLTDDILFRMFCHLLEEQPNFTDHPPSFDPQLAKSYEWSPDHKVLTFHLRKDAVWSDGEPITAEDVRWTWKAQTDPDVAWETSYMKEDITDVEVVDPFTVRFHFSHVSPAQLLHANEGVILPKHAWSQLPFSEWRRQGDWFRQHMVSSGPFRLESWEPGQQLTLVRNDKYFEKDRPYLDRVVMRVVPEQSSQLTQLLSGSLDYVTGISPEDAARVQKSSRAQLIQFWHRAFVFVTWNNRNPLFSDVRVRLALTYGIDRRAIIDTLWGGYARIATSPIVATVWAHNSKITPWPYDPEKARELLAEAGWKDTDGDGLLDQDGRPFSFDLVTHTGNRERQDATVMIQAQLRKLGINARPRFVDFNTFISLADQGRLEAFITGLGMATDIDPGYLLASNGSMNYAHYSNPEVDRLLAEANQQREPAEAKPYYDEVQALIHRDQPYTFLWESKRLNAASRRVHNVQPNLLFNFYRLKDWWVEPES